MGKDKSIIEALKRLKCRFGDALQVADRWEGDLMAIGVSGLGHPDLLVYFCTFQRGPGRYNVHLESPARPGSEVAYEQGETFEDVDFETLVAIVSLHLGLVQVRRHSLPLQTEGRLRRFAPFPVRL